MNALRYDENLYILKSKSVKLARFMSKKGIKPQRGVFRINPSQKEVFPFIEFIDDVSDFIYFGNKNVKADKVAFYSIEDYSPSNIYFFPKKFKDNRFTPVEMIGYFNYNLARISAFNEKLNRKLFLKDFTYNTNIGIKNEKLRKMCCSDRKYLYLHNIVNRICLIK